MQNEEKFDGFNIPENTESRLNGTADEDAPAADSERINVLVLGNSGAGKSTLVNAIAGTSLSTGIGEGDTQEINVYDSATWPIRLIDTKGFEYNLIEQIKTIRQVKRYTKLQAGDDGRNGRAGVDVVWYCIEGTSRRMFTHNIEMMNSAITGWKNVPVFAVITKSYSESDEGENIEAVSRAFAKSRGVNLQKIIPVVAEAYRINNETVVEPKGIAELCGATIDCLPAARKINDENRRRMVTEQKRYSAQALTAGATAAAVVVGAVPTSFADSLILVPLECGLTKGIFRIYGVDSTAELVSAVVGSTAITNIARSALASLKAIPELTAKVAASALNAVVAGFFVAALGEAVIALTESIYCGRLDAGRMDDVAELVSEKIKGSGILGKAVNYLENNADKLRDGSAKDIFRAVEQAIRKKDKEE